MIYCVEDDDNIRELVIYTLETTGLKAKGFAEGTAFMEALAFDTPELILLDIMLPGEDGLELLKKLKNSAKTKDIPVIMVTAKGAEYDKVIGLDSGADDYVTKPFGMMELVSRIKAVLRRSGRVQEQDMLSVNGVSVDVKKHEVKVAGEIVTLTLKEFELLERLMRNQNIVLTRDQLLEDIWGYDFDGETRTVDVHVRTLRQKLGEKGDIIKTVRGVGYRISTEGKVLYDSGNDAETLENHSKRPEVKEALASGTGEDVRVSGTVGKEMYYYAILLQDGSVLRVAKTMDNLGAMARDTLPVIGVLAVVMMIFAWILGRWQTERLIRPINELDIEHPLENVVYEELRPLLTAMDRRNKEKAAVEDMRKEFSANVSHELKTPLTSISGYAEIMKNGLVRPEDIPNFSERIYKEAKRLITLIEDIIKLSKLDEGSVEIEKEEVDLYELSREIISRLSMQASMKHVHVSLSGEPVTYVGIRQILDEMIYNICENAIKYNVEGGSVSVWVGSTLNGPKVQVNDTGIGIPKEHQERIFERFYRVDKSHSKERGGTGLGLSIVKHGALLHNAKVSVESDTGKGTRMEILFETSQSE